MEVSYFLSREDYLGFNLFAALRMPRIRLFFLLLLSIAVLFILINNGFSPLTVFWLVILAAVIFALNWLYVYYLVSETMLGDRLVTVDEEGVKERTFVNDSTYFWVGVKDVVEGRKNIYIFLEQRRAVIIPKRAFGSEDETRKFLRVATVYWKDGG